MLMNGMPLELSGGEAVGGYGGEGGGGEEAPGGVAPIAAPPGAPTADASWPPAPTPPPAPAGGEPPLTREEIFRAISGRVDARLDELAGQVAPARAPMPPPMPQRGFAPQPDMRGLPQPQPQYPPQYQGPPPLPEWDPLNPQAYLEAHTAQVLHPIVARLAQALDGRFAQLQESMQRFQPVIEQHETQRADQVLEGAFKAVENQIGWFPADIAKKEAVFLMSRGMSPPEAIQYAAQESRRVAQEIGQLAVDWYKQQIGQTSDAIAGLARPAPGAGAAAPAPPTQRVGSDGRPLRGRARYQAQLEQSMAALQGAGHIRIPTG